MSDDDDALNEHIQHVDQESRCLRVAGHKLDSPFWSEHADAVRFSWAEFKTVLPYMSIFKRRPVGKESQRAKAVGSEPANRAAVLG
jgi:hypothetical protein